ncbi:MAG: carbohydrate ABC transporter permease [Actinobacteria bacterium]|nr:carbohydrate ABC transporter permease [Actinomycetota bacterium]MCG2799646.1 carbohydrate ABC transporter permease [Cellulomonas sp.]
MTRTSTRDARSAVRVPVRRRPRRTGHLVVYLVLIALALAYVYPFIVQVATSFKTDADAAADPLSLLPNPFSTAAYSRLFLNSEYPLWFRNSVVVTLLVTVGRVFVNSLAGYALARVQFRGRSLVYAGVVAVMAVPGVVLLIPKFLVLKELGIYNTYGALVLPLVADAAGVFIMKNYFESIPVSVEEAARIDGAGTFRLWWSIVLPMAVPALVTITILAFQGSWNELSHFIVASQDPSLVTLTKGVAQLTAGQLGSGTQYPLKLGAAAIMTIPVAVLFFVFQRRIMDASSGAVKG